MPTLAIDPAVRAEPTEADRAASRNRAANLAALARTQPRLVEAIREVPVDLSWVFGRDDFLTGFEPGERWYTGCSVPLLAARAMLKLFEPGSGVACFLSPSHAGQIRVALDVLAPNQALICIIPDVQTLAIALHCDDFSDAINAGRLWLAWGEDWAGELSRVLEDVPGLPTPTRFVRLPLTDASLIERLIAEAQRVFGEQTARRTTTIEAIRARWTRRDVHEMARNVCVIAPSQFRLWDDAGDSLFTSLTQHSSPDFNFRRFDSDDPAACSPLALASVVAESDAIVAANLSRADASALVPTGLPWITWITDAKIPPFQSACPNDKVLLADAAWRDAAIAEGWPAERIGIAAWAKREIAPGGKLHLALIADTYSLDVPKSLEEYSSHGLLWETIRQTIARDPFALPADIESWLKSQARSQGIAIETLDTNAFLNRLILPAYQQGLADALIAAGIPVKLYGARWSDLPRFRDHAAGAVTTRQDLIAAASSATALVYIWLSAGAHPIDTFGRPVVRRVGVRKESFLRDAKAALTAKPNRQSAGNGSPQLSPELLMSVLARMEPHRADG